MTTAASCLKVQLESQRSSGTFVPFVTAFGVLGLVMWVRIPTETLWLIFRTAPDGKFFRNRLRLELITEDFEFESARLLSLGALRLEDITYGCRRRTTFADVEGNEFDLIDGYGEI